MIDYRVVDKQDVLQAASVPGASMMSSILARSEPRMALPRRRNFCGKVVSSTYCSKLAIRVTGRRSSEM